MNVLYVPKIGYNLFPVGVINKGRKYFSLENGLCWIKNNEQIFSKGTENHELYITNTKLCKEIDKMNPRDEKRNCAALVQNLELWSQIISHVHEYGIVDMVRNCILKGINKEVS